jgi:diguanylate cyclase (GGDEF)-like protein
VFKAVDKERAEIDQLTGVYCRRRTFELFRQLFNEHIPNDDFDEGADAYSDGSCGSLDYFEFSGSADDADSCPYVDPLFVAGGEEDIDGYYDESVVDDVDVFGDSDGCPESSVKSLAFVFIDLDHFKLVNDIYGHSIGDRVLKIFGRVLKKIVRSTDIVGRFGGEEFVLALNNVTFEEAVWVCSRLRDETNKALREDEDLVSVCPEMVEKGLTASVGISFRGHNNELSTAEGHVNSADVAAYAVKRSGRDGIVYIKENKLYRIKSIRQLKDGDRIAGYEIEEEEILLAEVEPSSVGTIVGDDKFVIMNGKTYKVTVTSSQGRIINIVGEEVSDLSAPLSLDVFDEGGGI